MKKIFLWLSAALLCTSLSAQTLNEGFEGESFPPDGWTVNNGNTFGWKKGAKSGHNCAMVSAYGYGGDNYLFTPQLKPANGESLSFATRIGENTGSGELRVEVSLNGTDLSSFTVLETYYCSKKKGDDAHRLWTQDWRTFTINLSAYAGQRIYIAFHTTGEIGEGGLALDDVQGVTVAGSATCENPSNIVLSNLSSTEATFTWQGSASEYQYLLLEKGTEPDWTAATNITAKTVTLTGLYEETEYEFYVRAYCSADEQSMAPKTAFKTPCQPFNIPWLETFTRDASGSGFNIVEPDCWTIASGTVSVVKDKTYNDEGQASTVNGQAHLQVIGGGPNSATVFAMPAFNARLDTLEVAFDYKTNLTTEACGVLEVGYMTNPSKASTFISLTTLQRSLTDQHAVVPLSDLPSTAKYIAFRFAGGTSDLSSLSMDNFVVAKIGHSAEVDPSQENVPDAGIWALTYCEASFTWYSYNTSAFAIGLADSAGTLIAGIAATKEECDRFAYQDSVGFSQDDDYENHYYCSTKWILNVDESGQQRGDAWNSSVINIGTATSTLLALKPGSYQVQVLELNQTESGYSKGAVLATIPFTLVEKKVENLAVAVAQDKTTATLTWDAPEFGQGERLYIRVWSGETVAYDNFATKDRPASPLTVNVIEGKSYTAIVVVVDKNNNPLGSEVAINFTVGTNNFEPTNVHAEVAGGDNVTFSWEAAAVADRYVITLYCDGEFYTTLNVSGTSKMTTMPKDGTWTWTVQAFNKGANDKYFEASNAIEGNSFVTKAADIPEDAVVMNVWGMEAGYLDQYTAQFPTGKFGWMVMFATGEEGGTGMPMPTFLIWTDKEGAISGVYNTTRSNIDLESCYINTNGTQAGCIMATDAEVRLQFVAYDDDKAAQGGYRYGYYTGQFRLVGTDGKTYVGKFMETFCNSYNYSTAGSSVRDHKGMWDEDPDYVVPHQGIESIKDSELRIQKILIDGNIYIIRENAIYTIQGVRVK